MPTTTVPITHVSDTARWVAYYRAMETDRPDAHFRDPFAKRLAGAHGEEIVNSMKQGRTNSWPMVVRTTVFDQVIRARLADGCDQILNLACGLDARPWRMAELPKSFKWVDADFPGILDYKLEVLKDETPLCDYEAVRVDLTDAAARDALFARVAGQGKRTLVITEGLLIYLKASDVSSLAQSLAAHPSFRWWLSDLASPKLLKWMERGWGKEVAKGNAPFIFGPAEGTGYFKPYGWREKEWHAVWDDAKRLNRRMPGAWLWDLLGALQSAKGKEEGRRFSGTMVLERAG
jgi:methyltransferase (TIGR00027 family)